MRDREIPAVVTEYYLMCDGKPIWSEPFQYLENALRMLDPAEPDVYIAKATYRLEGIELLNEGGR